MASHLSEFIALYSRFGIVLEPIKVKDGYKVVIDADNKYCEGHPGFYSTLTFTDEGEFVSQEFLE